MLKFLSAVALSVFLSLGVGYNLVVWHQSQASDISMLRAATHVVSGGQGDCSGVAIATHTVLTAAHCDQPGLTVDGKSAKVLKKDEVKDLLLLEVAVDCPCIPVAKYNPAVNTNLVLIGYPYGRFLTFTQTVTYGEVQGYVTSSLFDGIDLTGFMITTTPTAPGNSGGGAFSFLNGKWQLVAIVSRGAGHIGVFSPASYIQEFLKV